MNKNDRSRNMMTGLGVVVFIMLVFIILPFMIPVLSVIFSMLIAFGLLALGLWLCIILITSIGAMFNSVKDRKAGEFAQESTQTGKDTWNSFRDKMSTILHNMSAKVAPDNVIYADHVPDDEEEKTCPNDSSAT